MLCSALCAPCASGPAMIRTAPLLGTGSTESGGPTRPRPSCRSRRVPRAGLSCQPVAPSVVRGSYAVVVGTLALSLCGAVQAAVPPFPPALWLEVRRVRGRLVSPQCTPVVEAYAGTDGTPPALVSPAPAGTGKVDHASFSSGRVGSVRAVITAWARRSVATGSTGYRGRIASATWKGF